MRIPDNNAHLPQARIRIREIVSIPRVGVLGEAAYHIYLCAFSSAPSSGSEPEEKVSDELSLLVEAEAEARFTKREITQVVQCSPLQ